MPVSAQAPQQKRTARLPRAKVLVAVQPTSMGKVIQHLFRTHPELELVEHRSAAESLPRRAERLRPDVIVANARVLGRSRWQMLAEIKRSSPESKLVVICPMGGAANKARENGADASVEEEAVVRQLMPTVRRLAD